MKTICTRPRRSTAPLWRAVILTASLWLPAGCATRGTARPDLPLAFHFMEPGSTNSVIVPADCAFGVWTTDKGLLYLQGLLP